MNSRRKVFGGIALISVGLLGYALFTQHVQGLQPCPLCILQRYAFILVALLATVAAVLPRQGKAGWIFGLLTFLGTLVGTGVAGWHSWLQKYPPQFASCGADFNYLIETLPLSEALPKLFQGTGDCSAIDWTFLGLSMPNWALIWFVIFGVAAVFGLKCRNT